MGLSSFFRAPDARPNPERLRHSVARGTRLRTVRGLRVGAASSAIKERHPDAEFQSGGS